MDSILNRSNSGIGELLKSPSSLGLHHFALKPRVSLGATPNITVEQFVVKDGT